MKKFRFTIIELLLVISIAGVMISVAVPAFSRMLKGSASGIAVRELMGKLNAARAYAVANKTYVAVVFPVSGKNDDNFKKLHTYRSYRACEIVKDDTEYRFLRWIPNEKWCFFPKGIILGRKNFGGKDTPEYFMHADANDETKLPTNSTEHIAVHHDKNKPEEKDVSAIELDCTLDGRTNGSTSAKIINYIVYRPDGTTDVFPYTILLRLRDGKVNSDGNITEISDHYYPLSIRFNGKIKATNTAI